MRFLLFDRITHLEPGRRVEGVKCWSLTEEYLRGGLLQRPGVPGSLVIESMVQLAAWAAISRHGYGLSCVLSMLDDVRVPAALPPGTTCRLVGELLGGNPKGSFARAWAEVDGERVASIGRVLYAHVPMPDPAILRERLRLLGGTP